jgi:hypothetical protein
MHSYNDKITEIESRLVVTRTKEECGEGNGCGYGRAI